MNPNFQLSLCDCEECQDSHPKVISGGNRIAFRLNGGAVNTCCGDGRGFAWSWAALPKAWLFPCSLDSKANSRLPGGLPGGSKDVWSQERLLSMALSWTPTLGMMSWSITSIF